MQDLREAEELIRRLEAPDVSPQDSASVTALERLLSLVDGLRAAEIEALCAGAPRLARFYGRHVQLAEAQEAKALIERGADAGALARGEGGDFAGRSYARVRDMFERVDFTACREFVMVGCGPLPVTLLHVARETRVPRIVGLDADETSARSARAICQRLARLRIEVLHRDGCDHGYGEADVIYLANLIRPKARVLACIAGAARPGTRVIVREPFAAGALLAEQGIDPRDPRLKLLAFGPGDPRFLSRHVFLERSEETDLARSGAGA